MPARFEGWKIIDTDQSAKPAVVTGGGKGLGAGVAWRLAMEGAPVLVVDRDKRAAQETAQELGSLRDRYDRPINARWFEADVTEREQVKAAMEAAVKKLGSVRTVAAIAGIYPPASITGLSPEEYLDVADKTVDVNLRGVMNTVAYGVRAIQAVPPPEGEQSGNLIVATSVNAVRTLRPGLSPYDSTKAGVEGYIRSLAGELAAVGIRINGARPGGFVTDGIIEAAGPYLEPMKKDFEAQTPLGIGPLPSIGEAAVFLASQPHITGEIITVDGGYLAA